MSKPEAETFDGLRQRIRDRFPLLSPHLQRIARASFEEPNGFALNTTAKIAGDLEIQPSTLIRFAKEFGYSGFSDMQKVFRQRLIEGAPEPAVAALDRRQAEAAAGSPPRRRAGRWEMLRTALALIGAGVLFGLAASAVFHWERIAAHLGLVP